ncbi:MAG TPA: nucleoside deaminase [Streptosporangiaceae bacterium]|nr:nucleoside deaminase [Streptosporangiaceae bacterium]
MTTTTTIPTRPAPLPGVTGDCAWLERAVALAISNVATGGGPFGALVVRDGRILGQSGNRVTENNDPTAHAEVMAIRAACSAVGDFRLDGALLVSSCEPCPMCLGAALWSRVARVIYAADRHDAARVGFDDDEFYEMLDRPRLSWSVPVRHLALGSARQPFDAWSAAAERIDY